MKAFKFNNINYEPKVILITKNYKDKNNRR